MNALSKRCCIRLLVLHWLPHMHACTMHHSTPGGMLPTCTQPQSASHHHCWRVMRTQTQTGELVSACCLHRCLPEVICMARTDGKHIHLGLIGCHDLQWLILRGKEALQAQTTQTDLPFEPHRSAVIDWSLLLK